MNIPILGAFKEYLEETDFLDFQSEEVQEFVNSCIDQNGNRLDNMVQLYYKVRDTIRYDVSEFLFQPKHFKASSVIKKGTGYCIPKAILLAATARAIGVPSKLCFADVVNHIATDKFRERLGSDVFVFHSYTDLYLNGKWVKATPSFNKSLCERFDVLPLEFDGNEDSMFQQFDGNGKLFMEYKFYHGCFADLPYNKMTEVLSDAYPHLMNNKEIELIKNN